MESRIARLIPATVGALSLAVLCGCASSPAPREAPNVAPDMVGKNLASTRADDGDIADNIRQKIAADVPGADIAVTTQQGKVALTGTVTDTEAARKAVKSALAVEGVRGVVNDLDVREGAEAASPTLSAAATL